MRFFNFVNSETYHFFQWLCKSDLVNVDALIARAAERVMREHKFERGVSISLAVREELVGLLEEELVGIRETCWSKHQLHLEQGIVDEEDLDYGGYDALFGPLLCESLGKIALWAVAKALLIRAGKWSVDGGHPEEG